MPPVVQEDQDLLDRYNAGDQRSGQLIFVKHHKLILKIVLDVTKGRFYSDDALQAGAVGLCIACQRYDKDIGVAFTTYAYYWIRKYVIMEVSNDILPAGGIVFGRGLKDKIFKYIGLKMTGYTDAEIAERLHLELSEIHTLSLVANQASRPVSIPSSDTPDSTQGDDAGYELYGIPTTESAENTVLRAMEDSEYTEYVESLISSLEDPNEQYILNHTLGLNGKEQLSRSDMLKELKLSAKQLAELRRNAYRNIKQLLRPGYTE